MSSGSFGFTWIHSGAPRRRHNQLGSIEFTQARLGVVVFSGSLGVTHVRLGS